jgi:lipopolysaccharide transport system ATP-binding protein
VGPNVLEVSHLSKSFRIHHEKTNSLKGLIVARGRNRFDDFTALNDISFVVGQSEVFGVIGHNGSGKSTLLKCMAGILVPNRGSVAVHRRMSALLELGAGFHPELSGRENVFLNAAILGMGRKEIAGRFDDFIDSPVKTYSSGMYVRLAFAVAINVDPELLIIDEILAVGDVTFQQKCMEKFVDFRNQGRTIILVTHSMSSVRDMCDRAIWLDHGKLVAEGDPTELVEAYTDRMLGTRSDRGDGSTRRGSGEINIERVEMFVGSNPTPVKRFRTGDDVTLRLHYRAEKAVSRPVFGIAIDALGGNCITSPCTRDVGMVPERVLGEGHVDVSMTNIALMPGTFDLHTSITDFNRQHMYDHLQVALRFDVMTGKLFETGSAVTLRPEWTMGPSGVAR